MITEELFRSDSYLRECEATVVAVNALGGIVLDRSVFYPTGGGQPGDCGVLVLGDGGEVRIATTLKGDGGENVVHVPQEGTVVPEPGDRLIARLDWERRYNHMRMHTCLHLLCAVVPHGVTGGKIGAAKSSLDFDIGDATLDKQAIGLAINELIAADHPVGARWISDAELDANPDLVRTMSVRPPSGSGQVRLLEIPGVDLQPCGGTHLARTGEIGPIRIGKIENKGKRNRRVNIIFDDA
ncbi:MAG: Alanine--tRNA ligase [Alphaproteobacteria bacterium MarineAlpha10_Bin3]|nr:MAG: Alanine--tRNA ligase [Alphaproteobacteria bacterium MarineAlpha10_Bin3]PPR75268.1 MAG: Alanine--tRNA ligase [Alphaproteobacteria bacterium MarineAlpha4_Bin1]